MKKGFGRRSHSPASYRERTYRRLVGAGGLRSFRVVCEETDLMIKADSLLDSQAREQVLICRGHIKGYIKLNPGFASSLVPWHEHAVAPEIVRDMIRAGRAAGVGPMASVAGAVAESVGRQLLDHSRQVVVENGGDIFLKTDAPVVAGLIHRQFSVEYETGRSGAGRTQRHRVVHLLGNRGPFPVDRIG
jgi:ApbE superfamily uncharacterized protein (UPF0280 family)